MKKEGKRNTMERWKIRKSARWLSLMLAAVLIVSSVLPVWGMEPSQENLEEIPTEEVVQETREDVPVPEAEEKEQEMETTEEMPAEEETLTPEAAEEDQQRAISYRIEFRDTDGTLLDKLTILDGEEILMPETKDQDGYRRVGWASKADAQEAEFESGQQYEVTSNLTLYPVWEELYTINFLTNTGKTTARLEALTMHGIYGEQVELPMLPEYEGYRSLGWTSLFGASVTNEEKSLYTITGDKTFYQLNVRECSITYYDNSSAQNGFEDLTQWALSGETIKLPEVPEKTGYKGLGWTFTKGGTVVKRKAGEVVTISKNTRYYAVYEKGCTVSYYDNSNKQNLFADLTQQVLSGEKIRLPKVPEKTGYKGLGWTFTKGGTVVKRKSGETVTISKNTRYYAVYEKLCAVTFYDNSSAQNSFSDLTKYVESGKKLQLPKVPQKAGYKALGWTFTKGGSTVKRKAGDTVTIKKNTRYYAVYKKAAVCTLKFYTNSGNMEYEELRVQAAEGSSFTLPKLPRRLNYSAVGWGTKVLPKAEDVDKPGTKITVKGDMKFYGYWKKAKTVQFFYNNGTAEYMSLRKDVVGNEVELPIMASPKGYTFLGWSVNPKQSSYPDYEAGETISLTKGRKLYSVLMKQPMEEESRLLESQVYDQVYFVGDSRTVGMQRAINEYGENAPKNVTFLAKRGAALIWFEESLDMMAQQIRSGKGKRAVILNLGVNNLQDECSSAQMATVTRQYLMFMEMLRTKINDPNCDMYFMSINPTNDKECISSDYGDVWNARYPKNVREFNDRIRKGAKNYTYIDTYSMLINTGFELVDGLHYNDTTYCKIYNKAIEKVDQLGV